LPGAKKVQVLKNPTKAPLATVATARRADDGVYGTGPDQRKLQQDRRSKEDVRDRDAQEAVINLPDKGKSTNST
jgi:hypothetical protein